MYVSFAKAVSHPSVNVRRKIHFNHKNKISEDKLHYFCDLQSFLTSGKYIAQRNAKCQYEIILKFKYLTAASIGINFFFSDFLYIGLHFRLSLEFFSAVKSFFKAQYQTSFWA